MDQIGTVMKEVNENGNTHVQEAKNSSLDFRNTSKANKLARDH